MTNISTIYEDFYTVKESPSMIADKMMDEKNYIKVTNGLQYYEDSKITHIIYIVKSSIISFSSLD